MKLYRLARTNEKGERTYFISPPNYPLYSPKFATSDKECRVYSDSFKARSAIKRMKKLHEHRMSLHLNSPSHYKHPGEPWSDGIEIEVLELTTTKTLELDED